MKILKFGGSSLATPESIARVVQVVGEAAAEDTVVLVVSAFGGVTNQLGELAESARRGGEGLEDQLVRLERRHVEVARRVADPHEHAALEERVGALLGRLRELLHGVRLVGEVSARTLDRILGCGELLSAPIVAAALRHRGIDAAWADARDLIITSAAHGQARPDFEATAIRAQRHFAAAIAVQVVPGFIAATAEGETTTLGRGGSDFTASILAAVLDATAVELWTDVDGVMTADPRLVPGARSIRHLRYDELMELSHFGAKVVHPPSIQPVHRRGIPLWIKNTFDPQAPGTRVAEEPPPGAGRRALATDMEPIRGITSISSVTMARLEGDGMVGVPGVAMRLFGALADQGVSVILISQASSEHSICFCVAPEDLVAARRAVDEEFKLDRKAGDIDDLKIEQDVAIVAVIGGAMCEQPGIAGRLFSVLGAGGVNVRAIAQGSSELNISLVVKSADEGAAVNAIHEAFFRPLRPTARLFVAGVGGVGGALLKQIAEHRRGFETASSWTLRLEGVANSRSVVIDRGGIEPVEAAGRLEAGPGGGLGALEEAMTGAAAAAAAPRIFIDCTAAEDMAGVYQRVLATGGAVVTANKKPFAASLEDYRSLDPNRGRAVYHETTVGAGLPVLRTLRDLLATGDQLLAFEGVLSGTASFLAGEIGRGETLSGAVERAAELGYLEPDPRDDLAGYDVARKLLIVARLAGAALEWADLELDPVLPVTAGDPFLSLEPAELRRRLPELDESFAARRDEEAAAGRRLVYLASWKEARGQIGWQAVDSTHPCFGLAPGENLASFQTRRYEAVPLVVRGPGAGPEVTAAGVFADVLHAIGEQGEPPQRSGNVPK